MPTKRPDLNQPMSALKTEIKRLSKSDREHAKSIESLADLAHHEATRKNKSPLLFQHALQGLELSVQGFEMSHPKLVEAINNFCEMLSQIGI